MTRIKAHGRPTNRKNSLTQRWVPGHMGVKGNEVAGDWTEVAAGIIGDAVPMAYLKKTRFAHMARAAIEASSSEVGRWIVDHVSCRRLYSLPKGRSSERSSVMNTRAALAVTVYCCRSMRRRETTCARGRTSCHLMGSGGVAETGAIS